MEFDLSETTDNVFGLDQESLNLVNSNPDVSSAISSLADAFGGLFSVSEEIVKASASEGFDPDAFGRDRVIPLQRVLAVSLDRVSDVLLKTEGPLREIVQGIVRIAEQEFFSLVMVYHMARIRVQFEDRAYERCLMEACTILERAYAKKLST